MADDRDVLSHIAELVEEEQTLRSAAAAEHGLSDDERARLAELDVQLDQCWDLLRRRRAREEFGENPDLEHERPASVVEHYRQ